MLAVVAGAVALIVLTWAHSSPTRSHGRGPARVHVHRVPPYWIVHPNNTLAQISDKTGLSIAQLEAYNPNVDPNALIPGERLNLWRHPPKPRAKSPGPMFWVVKPGDSFGSIAAATQINVVTLEQLNPKLASSTLQPGERVRLRH
jgi:LysM repeat protein